MFGGDMPSNNDFTLSLLTNAEVLKMHKESSEVKQLFNENGKVAVTSKNKVTGETYLALFNISDNEKPMKVGVELAKIGINGKCKITNLWTGEKLGKFSGSFEQELKKHACGLYKIEK